MKAQYTMLGLVAVCMLTLRLMASFLGLESSQKDLDKKARTHSKTCDCLRTLSEIAAVHLRSANALPASTYLETDWFDKCFERATEPLMKSEEPMSSDALILWLGIKSEEEFENQKQQLIKMPPSHTLARVSSCLTCAVVGNSKFLRGSGLGSRINQHDMVLRMNQVLSKALSQMWGT